MSLDALRTAYIYVTGHLTLMSLNALHLCHCTAYIYVTERFTLMSLDTLHWLTQQTQVGEMHNGSISCSHIRIYGLLELNVPLSQ